MQNRNVKFTLHFLSGSPQKFAPNKVGHFSPTISAADISGTNFAHQITSTSRENVRQDQPRQRQRRTVEGVQQDQHGQQGRAGTRQEAAATCTKCSSGHQAGERQRVQRPRPPRRMLVFVPFQHSSREPLPRQGLTAAARRFG